MSDTGNTDPSIPLQGDKQPTEPAAPQPEKKKASKGLIIALVIIGVFLLCSIVSCIGFGIYTANKTQKSWEKALGQTGSSSSNSSGSNSSEGGSTGDPTLDEIQSLGFSLLQAQKDGRVSTGAIGNALTCKELTITTTPFKESDDPAHPGTKLYSTDVTVTNKSTGTVILYWDGGWGGVSSNKTDMEYDYKTDAAPSDASSLLDMVGSGDTMSGTITFSGEKPTIFYAHGTDGDFDQVFFVWTVK